MDLANARNFEASRVSFVGNVSQRTLVALLWFVSKSFPFVGVQFRCDRLLFVPLCDRLQHIPTTPKCCMQGLYQCRLRLGGTVQGGGVGGVRNLLRCRCEVKDSGLVAY